MITWKEVKEKKRLIDEALGRKTSKIVFVVASAKRGKKYPIVWGVRSSYEAADEFKNECQKEEPDENFMIGICVLQ